MWVLYNYINMKVIFLDFDGVLNSTQSMIYWRRELGKKKYKKTQRAIDRFCPIAVSNLNYIFESIKKLKIVISSSWRHGRDLETLKQILKDYGFNYSQRVIGTTPTVLRGFNGDERDFEILEWLEENKDKHIEQWAAIDDIDYFSENKEFEGKFFKTSEDMGLTMMETRRIIKYFGGPTYFSLV